MASGGMRAWLESGKASEEITEAAAERTRRAAERRTPLTGLSTFANPDETLPDRVALGEDQQQQQVAGLGPLQGVAHRLDLIVRGTDAIDLSPSLVLFLLVFVPSAID